MVLINAPRRRSGGKFLNGRQITAGSARTRRSKKSHIPALLVLVVTNVGIFVYNFVLPIWSTDEAPLETKEEGKNETLRHDGQQGFASPELQSKVGLQLYDDAISEYVAGHNGSFSLSSSFIDRVPRATMPAQMRVQHPHFPSGGKKSKSFPILNIPLYYIHVYKSGGTTFCSTAQHSKKRVPLDVTRRNNLNCNVPRDLIKRSVDEQLRVVGQYEVAANEHDGLPLLESMLLPPSRVAYVVTLREPLDRFLSHFRAAQQFSAAKRGAFKGIGPLKFPGGHGDGNGGRDEGCLFHHCSFPDFLHWLEGRRSDPALAPASLKLNWALGDFVLRYFVGFDACTPGACTTQHLLQAQDRLERLFTLVMILEELETTGWRAMRVAFGWPSEAEVRRAGTRRKSSARAEIRAHFSQGGRGWRREVAGTGHLRGIHGDFGDSGEEQRAVDLERQGGKSDETPLRNHMVAEEEASLASLYSAVGENDIGLYEYAKDLSKRRTQEIFRSAGLTTKGTEASGDWATSPR